MQSEPVTPSPVPTGVVTFLLTDVEGSTRLWESASETAGIALARQLEIISEVVAMHGGVRPEEQGEGDSAVAVFGSAAEAVATAVDIQLVMASEPWPEGAVVRVRIGLHSGEAHFRDDRNYTGPVIHRCARLRNVAYGGQTVASAVTASLAGDRLPDGVSLVDLGEHRLKDLSRPEQVFEVHHHELTDGFPPLRSLDVVPNNLPAQLTSFVGRTDELAEVEALVAAHRLVTLTGSGGCGKTRLAAQVAAMLVDKFLDGVWWIDLSPLTDPELVAQAAATAIGVLIEPQRGPLRALELQLRDRRLLVCLDNCEHLLDPVAEMVIAVLSACPDLTVLATSREALNVSGEVAWRVPSLRAKDALSLFEERAAMARPGFGFDGNVDEVATICGRLDGVPLAIELAAARVRALTPAQIASGLDDRFRILGGNRRGVTTRQQTLQASVEWSHDLLNQREQTVFRRLAVFTGGCTLNAAESVCTGSGVAAGKVFEVIAALVDKSLVFLDDHGEARYRMLDTIRQYAGDRLHEAGETDECRNRHLAWFVELVERAEPGLETHDQDLWLHRLESDYDNIRAAVDWGLSAPDPEQGRRVVAALWVFWMVRGHTHDGIAFSERAIGLGHDDRSGLQARLLCGSAWNAAAGGRVDLALSRSDEAFALATENGDDRHAGRSLFAPAYALSFVDFEAARATARQWRVLAERAGDLQMVDLTEILEALTLVYGDRHDEAARLLSAALARCRQRNDHAVAFWGLVGETTSALRTGNVVRGHELATEGARMATPFRDYFFVGTASSMLAWAKGMAGDVDGGRSVLAPVARSLEDAGPDVDVPTLASVLGWLCLWAGDMLEAECWLGRATQWGPPDVDNAVAAWSWPDLASVLRRTGRAEAAQEAVDHAIRLCQRLDMPFCLAQALDESARLATRDPDEAEDLHHQALVLRVEHGLRTFYVNSLDNLARCAARAERHAEGARLLGASDAAREVMGYPRPPVDHLDHDTLIAEVRNPLGEAFETAWAEGSAMTLDDAVAYAARTPSTRAGRRAGEPR